MKAFVTGGTGFIGGALVERLVADGWDVTCLVRPTSRTQRLRALEVDLVAGDVLDAKPWKRRLRGHDVVFHCAARVDLIAPDRTQILLENVGGTRNVLHACREAKVGRVVYLSSVAAIGKTAKVADETVWHDGNYSSAYEESKHRAEQVAFEFGRNGLDVVHVLPSVVLGYGDPKTGSFLRRYLRRQLPALLDQDGMASYVAVEDLVDGILLAESKGRPNDRYIFTQANWTTTRLVSELQAVSGVPPPTRRLSLRQALWLAGAAELFAAVTFQPPLVSRSAVRMAVRRYAYSSAKARRELGWAPRDFRERFAETVRRFQAEVQAHDAR